MIIDINKAEENSCKDLFNIKIILAHNANLYLCKLISFG